jgi:outer membrane lipoprotein-sorting protein
MKVLKFKLFFIALSLFTASLAFSQSSAPISNALSDANDLDSVLLQMDLADRNISTLQVGFKQTVSFTETGEKQASAGQMFFMKPNNILIEISAPQAQKVYIKSNTMTIWNLKTEQAVVSKVNDSSTGDFLPAVFINAGGNWGKLKRTNNIRLDRQTDTHYYLTVQPKQNRTWSMQVQVSKSKLNPDKITVATRTTTINIELFDYKQNPAIDKSKFNLPKNIETIRLD